MGLQVHHVPRGAFVLVGRSPDRKQPPIDRTQFVERNRSLRALSPASNDRDEERSLPLGRLKLSRREEVFHWRQSGNDEVIDAPLDVKREFALNFVIEPASAQNVEQFSRPSHNSHAYRKTRRTPSVSRSQLSCSRASSFCPFAVSE